MTQYTYQYTIKGTRSPFPLRMAESCKPRIKAQTFSQNAYVAVMGEAILLPVLDLIPMP